MTAAPSTRFSSRSAPVSAGLTWQPRPDGWTMVVQGALTMASLGPIWRRVMRDVDTRRPGVLAIDAARITLLDSSGIAFLLELRRRQESAGRRFDCQSLRDDLVERLQLYAELGPPVETPEPLPGLPLIERLGDATRLAVRQMGGHLAFLGELVRAMAVGLARPDRLRWRSLLEQSAQIGANSAPIVCLLGFLIGVIMAFQSAIPLQRFGADLYVANLVGLSLMRELGPLIAGIILAGRSGAAFAAEIGTMKVNEELDALATMGIDRIDFLLLPRVFGAIGMMPLMTVLLIVAGLAGAAVVMLGFGYPFVTFFEQLSTAARFKDLIGGLFKALIFGFLIGSGGCYQGLTTGTNAGAVGRSTTQAVVIGIIMIVIADGVFAMTYYRLGF